MKQLDGIQQGTNEWNALRARHHTASQASAMMGVHPNVKRSELLKMKALGTEQEFSDFVRKHVLEKGHDVEAAARPIAEKIVGDELYPVTGTDDAGELLASFDGLTMLEDICWECKQWNQDKADTAQKRRVPESDYWQVVQQLVVSGAEKALYTVTDGTEEGTVYTWMTLDPADEKRLRAAWAQFDEDLANYEHVEEKPEIVGKAPDALPSLHIEVTGMVTASNLTEFKNHALAVFEGIPADLQTDQDFADAEKTVKWCKGVEDKLEAAKDHALSQTASIDELFRTIDAIKDEARSKRLALDKLVKSRKEAIRGEIRQAAMDAFRAHVDKLNASLERVRLPEIHIDIAGAMKGKKTVASLRDAADAELARAKIEANQTADRIRANLKTLEEFGSRHRHLFHDAQQLALKEPDDLMELVKARVIAHEAEEKRRQEEERERIRQEEHEKLAAEQRRKEREAEKAAKEDAQRALLTEAKSHGAAPRETPKQPEAIRQTAGKTRPTDAEIVEVLALHYRVHESKVIEWLYDMDLEDQSNALQEELI